MGKVSVDDKIGIQTLQEKSGVLCDPSEIPIEDVDLSTVKAVCKQVDVIGVQAVVSHKTRKWWTKNWH